MFHFVKKKNNLKCLGNSSQLENKNIVLNHNVSFCKKKQWLEVFELFRINSTLFIRNYLPSLPSTGSEWNLNVRRQRYLFERRQYTTLVIYVWLLQAIGNSYKIAVPNLQWKIFMLLVKTKISLVVCTLTIAILTCFQNTFWKNRAALSPAARGGGIPPFPLGFAVVCKDGISFHWFLLLTTTAERHHLRESPQDPCASCAPCPELYTLTGCTPQHCDGAS